MHRRALFDLIGCMATYWWAYTVFENLKRLRTATWRRIGDIIEADNIDLRGARRALTQTHSSADVFRRVLVRYLGPGEHRNQDRRE